MKIKIDDKTYIESDGMQFVIRKYTGKTYVDKQGNEREGFNTLGYYGTIEQLMNGLIKRKILQSKATTFKGLSEDIQKVREEITQLINGK